MKIELKKDDNGNTIGYDIIPQNIEDRKTLGAVRDMIFFGFKDTAIKYDGIELSGTGEKLCENLDKLKFIQKIHQKH